MRGGDVIDPSSTGLPPRIAAALCHVAGFVGGLVFLAIERRSRFVRFHAWQSVLALGSLFGLGVVTWGTAMLMAFVSTNAFVAFAWISQGMWVALALTWIVLLIAAFRGVWLALPIVGAVARRRARID